MAKLPLTAKSTCTRRYNSNSICTSSSNALLREHISILTDRSATKSKLIFSVKMEENYWPFLLLNYGTALRITLYEILSSRRLAEYFAPFRVAADDARQYDNAATVLLPTSAFIVCLVHEQTSPMLHCTAASLTRLFN